MTQVTGVVGVVGAGQMGRGIAQVLLQSHYQVHLFDTQSTQTQKAREFIHSQWENRVAKGKMTAEDKELFFKNLVTSTQLEELSPCHLVIEAATENREIKFSLFKNLDHLLPAGTILASNTSSIPITQIASQTKRPDRVIGIHFMNPVPVMKLVEIITGMETSSETLNKSLKLVKDLGKVSIRAQDYPGFAINRILMPMINEAFFALFEGVSTAKDIDTGMKLGCNQPMGPLELADFIGLDTCLAILEVLYQGFGDPKYRPCPLLKQYVQANRLGLKVKKGVYEY